MSDVTEPLRRVCAGFVFATSNMFEPASKSESCCTSARDCLEKYDASSCPGNAPPLPPPPTSMVDSSITSAFLLWTDPRTTRIGDIGIPPASSSTAVDELRQEASDHNDASNNAANNAADRGVSVGFVDFVFDECWRFFYNLVIVNDFNQDWRKAGALKLVGKGAGLGQDFNLFEEVRQVRTRLVGAKVHFFARLFVRGGFWRLNFELDNHAYCCIVSSTTCPTERDARLARCVDAGDLDLAVRDAEQHGHVGDEGVSPGGSSVWIFSRKELVNRHCNHGGDLDLGRVHHPERVV